MIERFAPLGATDPQQVAGYVLHARLGSGGMANVYLSAMPSGRPVAIKVMRQEFADDPEFRRRFRREVSVAQRVQGRYTAPVVDADPDGRPPWLAASYVAGPSLHQAVGELGPFPVPSVMRLLAGVAEGLAAIHAAGLIHRDLKPSNVLLAADGPRVIDFGIAHAAESGTLTSAGAVMGTPAFMAPEQVGRGGTSSCTATPIPGSPCPAAAAATAVTRRRRSASPPRGRRSPRTAMTKAATATSGCTATTTGTPTSSSTPPTRRPR